MKTSMTTARFRLFMAYTLELNISPETSKTSCVTVAVYVVRSSVCLFVGAGYPSAIFVYVLMDINTLQNTQTAAHADQKIQSLIKRVYVHLSLFGRSNECHRPFETFLRAVER